jgi:hypothetical protein
MSVAKSMLDVDMALKRLIRNIGAAVKSGVK